jgi:hypothetical protein
MSRMIIPNFVQQSPVSLLCSLRSERSIIRQPQRRICIPVIPSTTYQQQHQHLWSLHTVSKSDLVIQNLLYSTSPVSSMSTATIIDPTTIASTITLTPTFEPILNIPAFTVFLFIMTIFILLQYRIRLIDTAANERNVALQQLRQMKVIQLSNPTNISIQQINDTINEYERTYNRFESLRTILPNIRIVSPPSSNINQRLQEEHEIAAQKYLGINTTSTSGGTEQENEATTLTSTSSTTTTISPFVRNGIILLIVGTQILLFLFLIGTDPMMMSSSYPSTTATDFVTTIVQ